MSDTEEEKYCSSGCDAKGEHPKPECDAPYRYHVECKGYLNLTPPRCLRKDPIQKKLYRQLYNGILYNDLEVKIQELIALPIGSREQEIFYDNLLQLLLKIFGLTLGQDSPRLTVIESDGRVIYDTAKSAQQNTVNNWNAGLVDENHNTRPAVMTAQLFEAGVGHSVKFSNTVLSRQSYVAVRAGQFMKLSSTLRLSQDV